MTLIELVSFLNIIIYYHELYFYSFRYLYEILKGKMNYFFFGSQCMSVANLEKIFLWWHQLYKITTNNSNLNVLIVVYVCMCVCLLFRQVQKSSMILPNVISTIYFLFYFNSTKKNTDFFQKATYDFKKKIKLKIRKIYSILLLK